MTCVACGMETCVTCRDCGGDGLTLLGHGSVVDCSGCHGLGCVPHGLPTRWYTSKEVRLIAERARALGYTDRPTPENIALFLQAEEELIRKGAICPR